MASAGGGASSPPTSGGDPYATSDSESNGFRTRSASPPASPCPYQNSHLPDGECTHFFDCPTHILERSDPEDDEAGPSNRSDRSEESRSESVQEEPAAADRTAPTEDDSRDRIGPDAPRPEPVAMDSTQDDDSEDNVSDDDDSEEVSSEQSIEENSTTRETGITLREALEETRQSNPAANETTPQTTHIVTQTSSRNPVSSPMGSAFSPRAEQRPYLDYAVPRWQPDAEATYCPICGTQFGFFVRKHHSQ